jgi:hypothetical protein
LFIGVIAVEQASTEELQQVTVGGGLTILGLGGRAEVSKQTRDYLERHQARYFVLQKGGSTKGWSSVDDVLSVDKLIERASVFKRGVSQDDTIANLSSTVSALLPGGTLTLQSGRTQAVFTGRCVE